MATNSISRRIAGLRALIEPVTRFLDASFYSELVGKPGISDFALGNPHEMPLPALVESFQRWIVPRNVAPG